MKVDYGRISAIIEELRSLDECQVYYLKDTVRYERVGPLVPPIDAILRNAFQRCPKVLDVGCGNGHTLLDNAELFELGVGLDDSDYMLAAANAARTARGIRHVEFRYGKAIALPFRDAWFDLVFSQRGPLGHHDGTLAEALRVLCPGGLILVETGWDFDSLQAERTRFKKHGVDIQLAATFAETLLFPDCYEFFRHYCVSWCSYKAARTLDATDTAAIDKIIADATDANGRLYFHWSRILIGGCKMCSSLAASSAMEGAVPGTACERVATSGQ